MAQNYLCFPYATGFARYYDKIKRTLLRPHLLFCSNITNLRSYSLESLVLILSCSCSFPKAFLLCSISLLIASVIACIVMVYSSSMCPVRSKIVLLYILIVFILISFAGFSRPARLCCLSCVYFKINIAFASSYGLYYFVEKIYNFLLIKAVLHSESATLCNSFNTVQPVVVFYKIYSSFSC